jgi:spore coat polysaccharide biosynthesis predicted glycosyltransferase SpsG
MNNKIHIDFLTFGGRFIGTGHLFRCLAISEWLKLVNRNNNLIISFYLYGCDEDSIKISKRIISDVSDSKVEVVNDRNLYNRQWEIVIVDLLNAPYSVMKHLSCTANVVASIDNISGSRNFSDIAVNPLYYDIDESSNNEKSKIKYDYIGPKYQIISPKYQKYKASWREEVTNILIIQGGADPYNTAVKIFQDVYEILSKNDRVKLHVVSGPASEEVETDLLSVNTDRVFFYRNIKNIDSFLLGIDVAISSIGITAFEIASMGIPSIHVTAIKKEIKTGEVLDRLGSSVLLGLYNELESKEILGKLEFLINNKSYRKKMRDFALKNFNSNNTKLIINSIFDLYGKF